MILLPDAACGDAGRCFRFSQNGRKVQPMGFPVINRVPYAEFVDPADHFIDGAEAELRHVIAHFLGDEAEIIDHVLWLAGELGAQTRILRGDANRTGIKVAHPHHDAAQRHQRRGREAVFLGAQQRGDDHVAAGLELAVGLHDDAIAQLVLYQHLLGLR